MNYPHLKGKNVMVVDDEEDLRDAIAYDLKRLGCVLFKASNATEAIELLKVNFIEIVVSDVRMPNGTGVDLLNYIRKIHPHIPFVMLATGFADLSESEVLKLGGQALMEKPIDRKKMLDLLEQFAKEITDNKELYAVKTGT